MTRQTETKRTSPWFYFLSVKSNVLFFFIILEERLKNDHTSEERMVNVNGENEDGSNETDRTEQRMNNSKCSAVSSKHLTNTNNDTKKDEEQKTHAIETNTTDKHLIEQKTMSALNQNVGKVNGEARAETDNDTIKASSNKNKLSNESSKFGVAKCRSVLKHEQNSKTIWDDNSDTVPTIHIRGVQNKQHSRVSNQNSIDNIGLKQES